MTRAEDELDQLLPATHTLQLAGRQLTLHPIRLGQLPAILRLARPLIEIHRERMTAAAAACDQPAKVEVEINLLDLMEQHGDTLLDLCSLLSHTDRAWLDALGLDDALVLVAKLIEVNQDFFARRMGPALMGMMMSSSLTGPVSSPSSGPSSSPSQTASPTTADRSPGPTPPSG
jgi:hypothetical protein